MDSPLSKREWEFCWGWGGGQISLPHLSCSSRWLCQSVLARKIQVGVESAGVAISFQLNGLGPRDGLAALILLADPQAEEGGSGRQEDRETIGRDY